LGDDFRAIWCQQIASMAAAPERYIPLRIIDTIVCSEFDPAWTFNDNV
jgi:hypothetical protein